LRIYLSCDNKNDFFVEAVVLAVRRLRRRSSSTSIELIYPPRAIGGDTGKVLTNILRISAADVILFDVTPKKSRGHELRTYNPGVMIEYGIVLGLDNPAAMGQGGPGTPWNGRQPRPVYRVFCNRSFPRSSLSPIINQESVREYRRSPSGRLELIREIFELVHSKIEETSSFSTNIQLQINPKEETGVLGEYTYSSMIDLNSTKDKDG
jgi:hypothetical protein